MKILNSKNKNFDEDLDRLLKQRKKKISNTASVSHIINEVKTKGDKAVLKYEIKFNKNKRIIPSKNQISKSISSLDSKVKKAIDLAYNRILKFHSLQKFKNISYVDKFKNKLEYKYLPISSVAIYVPGSTASYPSTVLHNAIPAIVAGVKRIVMINPGYKGKQNQPFCMLQKNVKLKKFTQLVEHQQLVAVTYGTKKIKQVDKIVGPGNAYVAAAQRFVSADVGIPSLTAGPSEILIVADKNSNPEWVASDLIAKRNMIILHNVFLFQR